MERIIEVKGFEHIKQWEKIIDQWIDNNLAYIQQTKKTDCIYWHNERANVGTLLGAIWQLGGAGTIEFEAEKKKKNDEGEYEGQIDLYFILDEIEYIVEAKFLRCIDITNCDIKTKMDKASADSKSSSTHNNVENTMSFVFIVPIAEVDIEAICKKLYSNEELNIFVKLQVDEKLQYNENTYNTVYLLGKYCKKGDAECKKLNFNY